jgi:multidrug efflux pump subunit AcrB
LAANFQSWRLAFATVTAAPAVVAGVLISLWLTGSTLNIQSFVGAIMGLGVSMANAILLVTFAQQERARGLSPVEAVVQGAGARLRPIVMTSAAMLAGMLPIALAWGEAGQQTAPLGRAVIGGLVAATFATLFVVPAFFVLVQSSRPPRSASLDPLDPDSPFHGPAPQTTAYSTTA